MKNSQIIVLVVALLLVLGVYSSKKEIKHAFTNTFRSYMQVWGNQSPKDTSIDIIKISNSDELKIQRGKNKSDNSTELSNEIIDKMIAEYSEDMAKCHKNRIPDVGEINGQVIIGIDIIPSGKVNEVKIIQSGINDETLLKCLVSIFYSIRFPRFEGETIQRAYPIEFQ